MAPARPRSRRAPRTSCPASPRASHTTSSTWFLIRSRTAPRSARPRRCWTRRRGTPPRSGASSTAASATTCPHRRPTARAALESLRRRLAQTKLTAAQLCVCAALFPAAAVDEVYYRDEVLAGLAHLVVDFEQLESTAKAAPCHLNEEAWRRIVRRLGVLNVKDPRALGGTYNLDLQQPDERRCAGVLMALVEDLSVEQPPAPKKKGKKKEPVVVVPPKDPTPGTAFLKDLVFRRLRSRTPSRAGSCPRSGARPRVRILGSRRSGAWPAPTNRATGTSRTRKREGTSWSELRPWFKVGLPRPA